MGSIHGRRLIYRTPNCRRPTSAGKLAVYASYWQYVDGAPRATQHPAISYGNLAIMPSQRALTLGHRVRPEPYCDPNRTSQNDPSCQNPMDGKVALDAIWPGAAAHLLCDRTPRTCLHSGSRLGGDCLRLKL